MNAFVSHDLYTATLKSRGPFAARHFEACYPGTTLYVTAQSAQQDPYIKFGEDESAQPIVSDVKADAYCNYWYLRRITNGELSDNEMWSMAVALARFECDLPDLRYITARRVGTLAMPQIVHTAVDC
jgi:hypothetical protein